MQDKQTKKQRGFVFGQFWGFRQVGATCCSHVLVSVCGMIVCGHYPVYLFVACVCCQLVVLLTGIFRLVSDFVVSCSFFTSMDSKGNSCRDCRQFNKFLVFHLQSWPNSCGHTFLDIRLSSVEPGGVLYKLNLPAFVS